MNNLKYLFLFILTGLIACQKNNTEEPAATDTTMLNVVYGTDALQKMDIYIPAAASMNNTKVIVLIHGGAWSSGDKSDFNVFVDSLKNRLPGYAIFNINYRLSTGATHTFPAQENDVKTAIEFIYSKRAEYKISDKFVLLGASAGGHLALLQGYKYTTPVKIKAIVSFFGPTNMTDLYNNPASPLIPATTIAQIVGATPVSNPTLYTQSSPITFANVNSSATMLLHGGLDPLVSPSQAVALDNKLQLAGAVHQYIFYPTEGHGWTGANLTHSFNAIQSFLSLNVN